MDVTFNKADLDIINERLKEYSFRSKIEKDLNYYLDRYQEFVTDVETGYPLEIYSYTNDLSVRKILKEVLDELSEDGQKKLGSILKPLDHRFKNATKSIDYPLLRYPKELWWYYRFPRILVGELKDDLKSEG